MPMYDPAHPGEVLRDYLGEVDVTLLAQRLQVARTTLSRVLNGHAGVSAVMAIRLAKILPNTTPEFWLRMQMNYDLSQARRKMKQAAGRTSRSTHAAA
ncbi:MAG TPA: HigA family addiction module antitoxin [Acidobacteriaceae bacterium]|nr:HigA family addiction module antitoxin [Acidobacteriaceae bacterium]